MTCRRVYANSSTTGDNDGAGANFPSEAHEFAPDFKKSSCCSIFCFLCSFCGSLVPLFIWPFTLLITPLLSSNVSSGTRFYCCSASLLSVFSKTFMYMYASYWLLYISFWLSSINVEIRLLLYFSILSKDRHKNGMKKKDIHNNGTKKKDNNGSTTIIHRLRSTNLTETWMNSDAPKG